MLIIFTGNGKGKTSAALGVALRALGHGWKVLVIQFFKGDWPVVFGETLSAKRHRNLEFLQMGAGFVRIMGDRKPIKIHRQAADRAMKTAEQKILSGDYQLVILDEIIYALDYQKPGGLIPMPRLLKLLKKTPKNTDLILTGRNAHPKLIREADLVTEMKEIKHPFKQGISAKKGIDY